MTSITNTECPVLQTRVKMTRKAVTLDTKMLVIRKTEGGEKRANLVLQREYGSNCDNMDILIEEINEITEVAGVDKCDPLVVTEVLECHSQPLSN